MNEQGQGFPNEKVENVNRKLHELSEEELEQVNGGFENLIKTIVGLAAQKIEVPITLPKHTKSEWAPRFDKIWHLKSNAKGENALKAELERQGFSYAQYEWAA